MGKTNKPVKYVVVDAFTDSEFKGNPAAVCLLEEEKQDDWLQSLAAEFNISETCYLTPLPGFDIQHPRFNLRWFTPVTEVKLCGHATLAAAHFCYTNGLVKADTIEFSTLSGILTARKVRDEDAPESENGEVEQSFLIELDFPAIASIECNSAETSFVSELFKDASVIDMRNAANNLIVVLSSAKAVTEFQPNFEEIMKCPSGDGLIISAAAPPESGFDFFSRYFCPKFGINEDPVCGSAHCALGLYWSKKMGKFDFTAYAASPRSGILKLHLDEQNNRIKLQGEAVTVMEGSVVV